MKKFQPEAYCVKCKKTRKLQSARIERDIRGKPRIHGICKDCNTHCYRYISPDSLKLWA